MTQVFERYRFLVAVLLLLVALRSDAWAQSPYPPPPTVPSIWKGQDGTSPPLKLDYSIELNHGAPVPAQVYGTHRPIRHQYEESWRGDGQVYIFRAHFENNSDYVPFMASPLNPIRIPFLRHGGQWDKRPLVGNRSALMTPSQLVFVRGNVLVYIDLNYGYNANDMVTQKLLRISRVVSTKIRQGCGDDSELEEDRGGTDGPRR